MSGTQPTNSDLNFVETSLFTKNKSGATEEESNVQSDFIIFVNDCQNISEDGEQMILSGSPTELEPRHEEQQVGDGSRSDMKDAKGGPVSATECHDECVDQTYSTSVKTNLDTKTGLDQLKDLCDLMEGLSKTPQEHTRSKESFPSSLDAISNSSKTMPENECIPRTPEVIIKDNILTKIANMEQEQQTQITCYKLKTLSSSESEEDVSGKQNLRGNSGTEITTPKGRRSLQRSSRVEQHDMDAETRKNIQRKGSHDRAEKNNNLGAVKGNVNLSSYPNYQNEVQRKKQKHTKKSHLVHPSINELRSPASSCSESNISEITSCAARVPSAFSSCRDSSAYSDYEDYDDYLAFENIGSGILCRVEMAEDGKEYGPKGEECSFSLQRSSSFTEDSSKQKMLSFPEWLKPIRRHSATSILSSGSMATQKGGTNNDLRYGMYPPFQNDPMSTFKNLNNTLNEFKMIGSNHDNKCISHKPSKSAWGRVKKMIYTRRGSLKKELGKKEFEASPRLNQKRNSTGSALANIKYANKISNANSRKISSNVRSGSAEESKPTFGTKAKKKSSVQSMMLEPKNGLKDTMYKPSEPLSDADEESNLNSPIFGRRNMEEYFYDCGSKSKDNEDNEYSDPSGIWMGPPDKREPKMSNSTFQHTPSNMDSPSTINKAIIRPNIIDLTQKGKHVPKENKNSTPTTLNTDFLHVAITHQIRSNSASSEGGISPVIFRKVPPYHTQDEQNTPDLKAIETLQEGESLAVYEFPMAIVTECVDEVHEVEDKPQATCGNVIKIPDRQRKAASLQYHLPVQTNDYSLNSDSGTFAPPRVASCNLEFLKTNNNRIDAQLDTTTTSSLRESVPTSTWDKVKKVLPGNIINSFSVPTSPTEVCPSSRFSDAIGATFIQDPLIENDLMLEPEKVKERSLSRSKSNLDIQAEIQKSYEKLQRNLSQEFQKKMETWSKNRVETQNEPSNILLRMQPSSPILSARPLSDVPNARYLNDPSCTAKLPTEFKRKYEQWQKMKNTPTSALVSDLSRDTPTFTQEPQKQSEAYLSPEFKRKLELWNDKMKETKGFKAFNEELVVATNQSATSSPAMKEKKIRSRPLGQQAVQEQDLKPEFRLKVAEWEVIKAMAGHSSKNVEEIQKLMPDDFNRKLKEWEQIKETGVGRQGLEVDRGRSAIRRKSSSSSNSNQNLFNSKTRKSSIKRRHDKRPEKHPIPCSDAASGGFVVSGAKSALVAAKTVQERDSAWLEKEIQKVHREKERLERERLKYAAKEEKLQKMYQATLLRKQMDKTKENINEEITVKTAKGEEFKFGGISEKFTKKLFEWEERKGITPESSTIALISPQYATGLKVHGSDEESNAIRKRRHSEGSFLDSATSTGAERAQSKSRFGSGGNISAVSSHSSNKKQPIEHPTATAENSYHNRHVKCARNDSLRTQVSIQLLDEKLSMIDYLRSHLYHCRDLEKGLKDLRSQLQGITSFRMELVDLRHGKVSENIDVDAELLSNKEDILHNLIVEQSNLENKQEHLEDKLKDASMQHDRMTQMLIDRLDRFSRDEMGHQDHLGSLSNIFSDKSLKSESLHSLTMFGRIQKLSEFLANETKLLKDNLQNSDCTLHDYDKDSLPSEEVLKTRKVIDIPPELFSICKDLREELVVLMQMQNLEATIESERTKHHARNSYTEEFSSRHMIMKKQRNSASRFRGRCKKRLSGAKNVTSFSESDLRYYSKNTFSNVMDTDESTSDTKSHLTSSNSMSRYGSDSPLIHKKGKDYCGSRHSVTSLEVQNMALDDVRARSNNSSNKNNSFSSENPSESDGEIDTFDDYDSTQREIYEKLGKIHKKRVSRLQKNKGTEPNLNLKEDGDFTNSSLHSNDESTANKNGNPMSYHMSSENISTPNSGRSRSASLLSSEYISEEEVEDINGNECDKSISISSKPSQDDNVGNQRASSSSFERLYNLVHELKEEDLNSYRERISLKNSISPPSKSEENDDIIDNEDNRSSQNGDSPFVSFEDDGITRRDNINQTYGYNNSSPHESHADEAPPNKLQFLNCPLNILSTHSTKFCLNDILVPTLPVLITPISLNTANLCQGNCGLPMRRNMEFHQDIGTAAYISVIQNQSEERIEPAANIEMKSPKVDVEFGSLSYAKTENMDITQDQGYQSLNLNNSNPECNRFDNDVLGETVFNIDGPIWDNKSPKQPHQSESNMKCYPLPLRVNQDSIESVESLICPPVATASTVPAQSCLCESTIASQTAMQDDCILQFPSAVVSYEKGGPITSDVDNINDGMADSNYVFCNDEVTFYSPGTELNESGTDDDEEGNIKCADVQVHVDSCYAQNNASIDMSYTQPINSFNEKAVCSKTPLNVEKTDVAIVVSRVTPTDELLASSVLNDIQKEDASIPISDKPSKQNNMVQNKKSFLCSPSNIDTISKTSKDSTRPKSFSSFFQHFETKYFPYKQQLSYDPSTHSEKENSIQEGKCNENSMSKGNSQNIDRANVIVGASKGSDGNIKPKKQKKSMFKSLFMSSNTHQSIASKSQLAVASCQAKTSKNNSRVKNPNNEVTDKRQTTKKEKNISRQKDEPQTSMFHDSTARFQAEKNLKQMGISSGNECKALENTNSNTYVTESSQETKTTTELRLRSQERARQIKKAREEFLCIPGTTTENKINTTSSVGDLPFQNETWYWKRKLQRTMKKSVSNNEGIQNDTSQQTKNLPRGYNIFENYENQFTHNNSNVNQNNLNFRQDQAALNKSYSCPSSPKL